MNFAGIFTGRSLLIVSLILCSASFAVTSPCRGRQIPSGKTRQLSNLRLECTSNSSHYIRGSGQGFDFHKWNTLLMQEGSEAAQKYRQEAEALIEWTGSIPYQTVEVWDWVDWVFGHHPSCPPEVTYVDEPVYNAEGKQIGTEQRRVETPKPCWHDEPRHEEEFCSSEIMHYAANFRRPTILEWHPPKVGEKLHDEPIRRYYDVIPNKYDLLPGEVEDVQIFSNSGQRSTISPNGTVGDAWNKYSFQISFEDGPHSRRGDTSVRCNHDVTHKINVTVNTEYRIKKQTPNAFRMPVDAFGRDVAPIKWLTGTSKKGVEVEHAKPREIHLSDAAHVMIRTMARQARELDAKLEESRQKSGEGGGIDAAAQKEMKDEFKKGGFFKQTQVRVRLMEYARFVLTPRRKTHNLYLSEEDVALDEYYQMRLGGEAKEDDLFRASGFITDKGFNNRTTNLRPGMKYEFRISMYQQGVPFYNQEGESFFKGESSCYSKELKIPFVAHKEIDDRGFLQKFIDWQGDKF